MLEPRVVIVRLERKHFSFIQTLSGGPLILFVLFFPHGFSESCSSSFRHGSGVTTAGFEGAERSRLWYPTETLCVGAPPGRIFTLLAPFHTMTTQRRHHGRGNVKNVFTTCVEAGCVWGGVCRQLDWRQQPGEEAEMLSSCLYIISEHLHSDPPGETTYIHDLNL